MALADMADQINASPQFRSAATSLAEKTLNQMLFDVTDDNRVIITLPGQTLQKYKSDWIVYNSHRLTDKIPFSTYLFQRLSNCNQHTSDKSIYLRAEDIQQLDKLADDNFMTAQQLVSWIVRTITPVITIAGDVTGEKFVLDPIPAQVFERYASRCYPPDTPVSLMNIVIRRSLLREVGLD
jgi:hypothetical protein